MVSHSGGKTLFAEAESAFGDILELQKNLEKAEEEMLEMDTSTDEYYDLIDLMGEWEQQLEDHEPGKMKSRIERILHGMGFSESDFERDTGEFSGGWQMRIALAKLLLAESIADHTRRTHQSLRYRLSALGRAIPQTLSRRTYRDLPR